MMRMEIPIGCLMVSHGFVRDPIPEPETHLVLHHQTIDCIESLQHLQRRQSLKEDPNQRHTQGENNRHRRHQFVEERDVDFALQEMTLHPLKTRLHLK